MSCFFPKIQAVKVGPQEKISQILDMDFEIALTCEHVVGFG